MKHSRDVAIQKIIKMPETHVSTLLIFMAGMEAEHIINEKYDTELPCKPPRQTTGTM